MNKIDFKIGQTAHPQMIEKKTTQVALSLKWILFENMSALMIDFQVFYEMTSKFFWSCWPADDHENIILMWQFWGQVMQYLINANSDDFICIYLTASGRDGIKFGLCVSHFLFYEGAANLSYQLECVHWSPQTRVKCFVLVAFYLTWTDTSEVRSYTMLDTY